MLRRCSIVSFLFLSTAVFGCDFEQVSFSDALPMGRMGQCEQTADGRYQLTLEPENTSINPSPWYHFGVTSNQSDSIPVTLAVNGYLPRYLPKYSSDGIHWQSLPFDTVDNKVMFDVPGVAGKMVYVAGQHPIGNQDYIEWQKALARTHNELEFIVLGKSKQGKDIHAFTRHQADNNEWLVVLGRQHPPEITGAQALLDFSEEILQESPLSHRFFNRFNVLWIPNINPDGVAAGNWRHTSEDQDLNRDWNKFTQVESRLVKEKLKAITDKGGKIVFSVDFHSTYYDVFYTMPEGYALAPKNLTSSWLKDLQDYTNGIFKVTIKPGSNPDNGVYKQFIADTYKVPAITYEVGDNTPREKVRYIATAAAKTLMTSMLSYAPEEYHHVE